MGNQLAQPQKLHPEQLAELNNVVLKDTLGGGRLLKTVLCVHDFDGLVVIKVYHKRGEPLDLQSYEQQLIDIRDRLMAVQHPHVWPFQCLMETERTGYLIRPYVYANLYDRLGMRPFLTNIEKTWIAFQLLHALAQCHEQGVCHGDIKCENVLVTSWNWVFLTDFASYKPAYLPSDNPADFSFYFDIGGRRRCYIAPERFYESSSPSPKGGLQPSMDVFSAGCVIAEIFRDGKPPFKLHQLLSYRKGAYEPSPTLSGIDPAVQELILHMIQLDPVARLSPREYLAHFTPSVFPTYFESALHPFFGSLLDNDADMRVAAVRAQFDDLKYRMSQLHDPNGTVSKSDHQQNARLDGRELAGPKVSEKAGSSQADSEQGAQAGSSGAQLEAAAVDVGEPLLSNVGALLSDTDQLEARLSSLSLALTGSSACEGEQDGFLVDTTPDRRSTDLRLQPGSSGRGRTSRVEELVTEEVYEYQFREAGGSFAEVTSPRLGSASEVWDPRHRARRKEDVQLPKGGGWQWVGGWRVDKSISCDSNGWAYGGGRTSARWSRDCRTDSGWRRRRWVRQRSRRRTSKQARPNGRTEGTSFADCTAEDGQTVECEGMLLVLVLLGTLVRGAKLQESRRCAVTLLYESAMFCDDDSRLQRVVPYLVAMTSDPSASIRTLALHYATKLLRSICSIPPSDSRIFQDYILPSLSLLPDDKDEIVRVEYAAGIPQLAACAYRHLSKEGSLPQQPLGEGERSEGDQGGLGKKGSTGVGERPDVEIPVLRERMEKIMYDELVSGNKSNSSIRRALLGRVDELAEVYGRRRIPELLSVLVTFLNDDSWQLRGSFFESVTDIAVKSGVNTMVALAPFLDQGLQDGDASVVANALSLAWHVVNHGHLRKRHLLKVAQQVGPLLQHPRACIRARAIAFMAAAARMLPPADTYACLLPKLKDMLPQDPFVLSSELLIVENLKLPDFSPSSPPPAAAPPTLSSPPSTSRSAPGGSPKRGHARSASAMPKVSGPQEGRGPKGGVLHPVAPVYTVKVDRRIVQRGSTRHKAALVGVTEKGDTARRLAAKAAIDVRSTAALLTSELTRVATKIPAQPLLKVAATNLGHLVPQHTGQPGAGSSSPRIRDAMAAALSTGLSPSSATTSVDSTAVWRPRGVLLAHLAEHRKMVNRLAVARNKQFFVSASNDGTVKVWDLRHLERDVSFHSKLTYGAQSGKITAVTACEDSASIASVSTDGSVHVWRVEYVRNTQRPGREDYSGITGRQQVTPCEGAVLDIHQWGPLLIYVTQRGGVHAWDIRMRQDAWCIPLAPHQGLVERIALDPTDDLSWLLTGSSRGYLGLWDVRYRLLVNSWRHPLGCSINALAPALAPPDSLGLRGMSGLGPLVYVAAGGNEVALWDVVEGRCRQVFRVIPREETEIVKMEQPTALGPPPAQRNSSQLRSAESGSDPLRTSLAKDLAIQELYMPQPRQEGLRSVLAMPGGALLTAGSDRCVRYWDGLEPKSSYIVCGPPVRDELSEMQLADRPRPHYTHQYTLHRLHEVPILDECCLATHTPKPPDPFEDILRMEDLCHRDCVTDMATVEVQERMLLTCGRDGIVKAWR